MGASRDQMLSEPGCVAAVLASRAEPQHTHVQAGLPKQLRTIVDLEALLNDGTAYTLFVILRGYAEGENPSPASTVK